MAIIKLERLHSFIKRLAFNNAIKQLKVIKLYLEPQLKLDPSLRRKKPREKGEPPSANIYNDL